MESKPIRRLQEMQPVRVSRTEATYECAEGRITYLVNTERTHPNGPVVLKEYTALEPNSRGIKIAKMFIEHGRMLAQKAIEGERKRTQPPPEASPKNEQFRLDV